MNYKIMYFLQSNIFCMILFGIILAIQYKHSRYNTYENVFLRKLIGYTVIYCFADILAWGFDGSKYSWARYILYIANMVYIALPLQLDMVWFNFIAYKMYKVNFIETTKGKLAAIPLIVSLIAVFSTPITKFSFVIDTSNVYHRMVGAYITPLVTFAALLGATFVLVRYYRNPVNKMKRDEILPLILFPVPIVISAVIQILVYGTTVNQLGLGCAVLLVFATIQLDKISIDELTGLNNRRELRQYLNDVFRSDKSKSVFLCMIDVDYFKTINDTYGHLEGDNALKNVAEILKKACSSQSQRVFLSRYGGDEFIIAGVNYDEESLNGLVGAVQSQCREYNMETKKPYRITLSIGQALGNPSELESFEALLKIADERMYDVKKKRKRL